MNLSFLQTPGWRRAGQVLELVPFLAAIVMVPFVIPGGTLVPWHPYTMDLQTYLDAGQALAHGGDILTMRFTMNQLAFIYPMFSALVAVPLSYLPYTLMQLAWIVLSVLLIRTMLRRFGVPAGVAVATLTTFVVLVCEPVRSTLGYGQVNVIVLALVVLDLLPGRRIGPRGAMTGLAASIKLTPALFAIYLLSMRRWKDTAWLVAVFAATTAIGFAVLPHESIGFWKTILVEQDTRTGAAYYLSNQSVLGGMVRMFGDTHSMHVLGIVLGALVGLTAAIAGAMWTRRGEELFGIGLVGLGTLMASPLSWTHHFVWVVPLGIAMFRYALPLSVKVIGGAFAVWTTAGLILQWLPYAQNQELTYTFFQDLVSDVTPILSVALIIAAVLTAARRPASAPEPTPVSTTERHLLPEPTF